MSSLPSSRPMTLRQQLLFVCRDGWAHNIQDSPGGQMCLKCREFLDNLVKLYGQEIAREAYRTGAQDYNRVFTDKLGKCTYMEGGQPVYKQVWVGDAVRKANREVISKGNDLQPSDVQSQDKGSLRRKGELTQKPPQ